MARRAKIWGLLSSDVAKIRFADLVRLRMYEADNKRISKRTLGFFAIMAALSQCKCVECGVVARFFTEKRRVRSILEWHHPTPRAGNKNRIITRMALDAAVDEIIDNACVPLCFECHARHTKTQTQGKKQ